MPAFVTFGRVLFAVLFMYTGATKLFAIQPTADFIASKVTIPAMIVPYAAQLESLTGMSTPQLLAVTVGGFEILAGLMIAVIITLVAEIVPVIRGVRRSNATAGIVK